MRQATREIGQVVLTQHLRLSLIGTPSHAGDCTSHGRMLGEDRLP
jgi:hypothetical protein